MDFKNIGNQILNLDPDVRFVTIIDINDNKFLFSQHRPGVTNLLSKEESDRSLQFTLSAWKIRNTLQKQIGKGKFVLAEYEKIKRISMPLRKISIWLSTNTGTITKFIYSCITKITISNFSIIHINSIFSKILKMII